MKTRPSIFNVLPTWSELGPYTFSSDSCIDDKKYKDLFKNGDGLFKPLVFYENACNGSFEFEDIFIVFVV